MTLMNIIKEANKHCFALADPPPEQYVLDMYRALCILQEEIQTAREMLEAGVIDDAWRRLDKLLSEPL